MRRLHSNFALFLAPKKARVRHPILILSPFDWGSPRMLGLRSNFAPFLAPGQGTGEAANSDFGNWLPHPCLLGGPKSKGDNFRIGYLTPAY